MFRFLMQVFVVCVAIAVIALLIRAIF